MGQSQQYDARAIARFFDEYGQREWERLTHAPSFEVALFLHNHYLEKFLPPGASVLEIGAGPGRFSHTLARLGARIVVADISPVQLELNKRTARKYDFEDSIQSWHEVDICSLTPFSSGAFEAVVAYGGPISYALDRREDALQECIRVLQPGGVFFASVMALWGSARHGLPRVLTETPLELNPLIIASGDISPQTFPGRPSSMHMFRADEYRAFLERAGLQILALSASGVLSPVWDAELAGIRRDPDQWGELLRMELEASTDPGCLGIGTHIISVARKPV